MKNARIYGALCVVFAAALMAGCHGSSSPGVTAGSTKVTLQADWYPQPEHGGFYTALVKGYYRDEGLDLSIQPGGPYVVVPQQVASGAAQFGMASLGSDS